MFTLITLTMSILTKWKKWIAWCCQPRLKRQQQHPKYKILAGKVRLPRVASIILRNYYQWQSPFQMLTTEIFQDFVRSELTLPFFKKEKKNRKIWPNNQLKDLVITIYLCKQIFCTKEIKPLILKVKRDSYFCQFFIYCCVGVKISWSYISVTLRKFDWDSSQSINAVHNLFDLNSMPAELTALLNNLYEIKNKTFVKYLLKYN